MIHPMHAGDVARKFKFARFVPERAIEKAFSLLPSMKVSHITGIRSPTGRPRGWFIACPLTVRLLMSLPQEYVLKIIQGGRVAEKLGAKILGLGAFTKVVGGCWCHSCQTLKDPGHNREQLHRCHGHRSDLEAARVMGHDLKNSSVVVMGATGAIGRVCALVLAREARRITIVARNERKLEELAAKILYDTGLAVKVTSDSKKALQTADVVITVTSSIDTVIEPEDLKSGAVICDVARPWTCRSGCRGAGRCPGYRRRCGGVPRMWSSTLISILPKRPYACMAETMVLAWSSAMRAIPWAGNSQWSR